MSILDFFRPRSKTVPVVASARVAAALTPNSADIPENAHLWRRVGRAHDRNLQGYDHARMVEACTHAAKLNPLAKAHTRLVSSITVGANEIDPQVEGVEDDAKRKQIEDMVREFWHSPVNDFSAQLPDMMDSLTTTGSLILVAFTGRDAMGLGSGRTSIGQIDPADLIMPGVVCNPENAREPIAVLRRGANPEDCYAHPILRADDTVHEALRGATFTMTTRAAGVSSVTKTYKVEAPCWYLGINRTSIGQTVGISDLYATTDMSGLHDALVFGSAERSVNFGAFAWHADFPEGTEASVVRDQVKELARDLEDGSGRLVGTSGVTIQALAAALQATDYAAVEQMIRKMVAIGLGPWPLHMLSDGTTTNVATAAEQGSPVANFLLSRQNAFRRLLVRMVTYAVRQRTGGRKLLEETGARIHIPLPVIVAKDTTRESNTLSTETAILSAGVSSDFITRDAAARNWRDQANRYGFHVKPEDTPTDEEIADRAPAFTGLPMPEDEEDGEDDDGMDPPKKRTEGTPEAIEK